MARFTSEQLTYLHQLRDLTGSVAVVGSMNADYTVTTATLPRPGETVTGGPLTILPGGKSANQAAAAALLGAQSTLFGAVGQDSNADFLLSHLTDASVDVSHVHHAEGPSGTTVITVDGNGENTIVYSAGSNATVTPTYIDSVSTALTEAATLGLCLEAPLETVTHAAQLAHAAGRTVLLNDSPFVADLPAALVGATDVLLVNEHEMAQLIDFKIPSEAHRDRVNWNDVNWSDIAGRLATKGFEAVIVTLGEAGSVVIDHGRLHRIDPISVPASDTTGAGDSFMGTVLAGLSSGKSLLDSARLASYVAAYSTLSQGAQASYGTAEEIIEYFTTL